MAAISSSALFIRTASSAALRFLVNDSTIAPNWSALMLSPMTRLNRSTNSMSRARSAPLNCSLDNPCMSLI